MTDRLDPKLYEEVKLFAIRLAERAEEFKKLVLRANDAENIASGFDDVLDVVGDTRDALEEELGEGAFDEEAEEEEDDDGLIDVDEALGEVEEEADETEEEEEEEAEEEVTTP
jgi:hypothetical protein